MWLYEIYNVPFLRPAFQPLYFYTMKAFLPLAALLLMASSGFCQTEARRTDSTLLVRPLPYRPAYVYYNPNRPSAAYMSLLFEEEAKVLPRLYKANDFAGMRTYVDSVLQKSGAFWNYWRYETAPYMFCVQTLLAIQTHQFTIASLQDTGFTHTLADVARIMRQMNRRGYSTYLFRNGIYAENGLTDHFITFTRGWAKNLLATEHLNDNEAFLCKVFTGEIDHPINTVLDNKKAYAGFDSLVVKNFKIDRRTGFFYNFLVSGGIWSPTGGLGNMGNHASLGYNLLGLRDRWNEYDIYFAHRFLNTPTPIAFVNKDTLYHGRRFYSGYYGFDYTRFIISTPHFETGVIAGIAGEEVQLNSPGGKNATLSSFSMSAGLRMNYFFTKFMYIGAAGKYSWLNYANTGGTNITGNAFSGDVYVGVNILAANKGKR